ncbi:MAG: radical SAM family heme chaperone HemW [Bacteroidales bacterium]|nr:radical SAM family heme chaperone HemW [Bacteroidales bacterium]
MIYIHVPFCKSFCTYCDFYSELVNEDQMEAYTQELCREIRRRSAEMDNSLHTLYFGGGTPSLLPLWSLSHILLTLDECGHGGPYTEFTMEVNPEDIVERGLPYVQSLKALGVNRLSIGVQSLDDDMLRWMNRRHNAEHAREAFRIAREAGMENVSIDLIFGLSNLSDAVWERTVDDAVALGPEHISCYQLTVEGDNVLAHMLENGDYEEASDEQCLQQYKLLCSKLHAAGYNHYEISNFAKPGFEAKYNSGYWQRHPYVGLGPAAHSFSGRGRSWNESVLTGYTHTEEALSVEDEKVETLMLSLRTARGADAEFLEANCLKEDIDRLVREGALVKKGRRYRIPEDHFFVSDQIIRELI